MEFVWKSLSSMIKLGGGMKNPATLQYTIFI